MKRSVALVVRATAVGALAVSLWATAGVDAGAVSPDTVPPDGSTTIVADQTPDPSAETTVVTTVAETEPQILDPDAGAATPAPAFTPSAPLIQIPSGCPSPDAAMVIFVGEVVAKDRDTARYQVLQVRAGNADAHTVSRLIDIRYDNETQYLDVGDRYLVGAKQGDGGRLVSKVQQTDLLFGGNAVIGLADKNQDCPVLEDQIRTFHTDGTEVETSLFAGLSGSKRSIALAFARPLAVVFAVILALALVRWLFTAIFVAVRQAADVEPVTSGSGGRQHLPDL
ncbi:MAG: hypothetical protein ABIR32_05005 [Ilumatobacteraceae bacterium]